MFVMIKKMKNGLYLFEKKYKKPEDEIKTLYVPF